MLAWVATHSVHYLLPVHCLQLYNMPEMLSHQNGIHISEVVARLKQSGANYTLDQVSACVHFSQTSLQSGAQYYV